MHYIITQHLHMHSLAKSLAKQTTQPSVYLSIESNPEVSPQVPLPRGHDVHHLPEGLMQLAVHLRHVLEVFVLLVERLQQLQDLRHHLVSLSLLQVIDAGFQ